MQHSYISLQHTRIGTTDVWWGNELLCEVELELDSDWNPVIAVNVQRNVVLGV